MASTPTLPTDNDGWFKRHIIDALTRLENSHETVIRNQQAMHGENVRRMEKIAETLRDHEESDLEKFGSINQALSDLQPTKRIVYGAIALVLMTFMGALIGIVIARR